LWALNRNGGSVHGRFDLVFGADSHAELGYRVDRHVAGWGVATATVRELCQLTAVRYGIRRLRAATAHSNVASQKVLTKTRFAPVGPADPAHHGGKAGTWYERDVTAD